MEEEEKKEEVQTESKKPAGGSGLEPNIAAFLAYLLGPIGGLVFLLIEKNNKFVKFAGAQSLVLGIAAIAVWIVLSILAVFTLGLGFFLYPIFSILYLVLSIVLMVKAYQNKEWELPVIGGIARNFVK